MAGFNGFGGGMNMQNMLKQAQKMQEQMQKDREELENTIFYANAGGGMVDVEMNGKREIVSLKLKPEVVNADDVEMLEDLIVAAINDANRQIDEKTQEIMPSLPGGMF